jgi:hypothetical protein
MSPQRSATRATPSARRTSYRKAVGFLRIAQLVVRLLQVRRRVALRVTFVGLLDDATCSAERPDRASGRRRLPTARLR